MSRGYAVVSLNNSGNQVLSQSDSFDMEDVRVKVQLDNDQQLWISGDDGSSELVERLQSELAQAQSANQAKEAFLSNMSHDIRTPMNAIVGMTALAKKHIDEKKRVLDSLDKIEIASSHLLSLINEVLDMSRINSGRMVIANDLFTIGDLLHETMIIVNPQAKSKDHHITYSTGSILYENLYGDSLRLRQIFVNIINNSIKYTENNGEIAVSFWQQESEEDDRIKLCFRCQDNGIGMSQEFLDKLFTPFERANTTTIARIEGTGLGMSIVKRIIESMNGTIEVESQLGKGTCVTICIPLAYEEVQIDSKELTGKKLLIVEKDRYLQDNYRQYLGEFSIDHTIVENTTDAISALTDAEFHNRNYDCVIIGSDIGSDGNVFEFASYLQNISSAMPIILISQADFTEIEYRAGRSGIDHFIPVPFFRKSLINGLNEALKDKSSGSNSSKTADLTGKRILLVEDNMINRMIANEILKMTNAQIDNAEDGQQAVDMFTESAEGYYDVILMDIQMPVMDGYSATKIIRETDRSDSRKVKIFAMTANAFAEDVAKARQAGMDGHIAKPIDINRLMQTLSQAI